MSPRAIPTPRPRLHPITSRRTPAPRRWGLAAVIAVVVLAVAVVLIAVVFHTAAAALIGTVLAPLQGLTQ